MEYRIERNIPVPERVEYKPARKYPFATMKEGDSFWAPMSEETRLRAAVFSYNKRHETNLKVSRVEENGVRVLRCWLLEAIDHTGS